VASIPLPPKDLVERLSTLCGDIDEEVVRDFVSRMDPDYFMHVALATAAEDLHLIAALTPDEPCQMAIAPRDGGRFEIKVVAYDYFSEFATICGLLSAFGLNIEEGRIYTFAESASPERSRAARRPPRRPKVRPGLSRKKIVDVFLVRPVSASDFASSDQDALRQALTRMIRLLDEGKLEEARQQVNRRLVERLSRQRGSYSGLLKPVQIAFDNSGSPKDTIMEIRSDDTPAFLYAFANALALRNIYITKAEFESEGTKLHDRFYVRNRDGEKILDHADQQQLRLAAVLIKQFTHALSWAPDPAKALDSFDQFLQVVAEETDRKGKNPALDFLGDEKTFPLLARLLGASEFIWEDFLRRQHGNLLPLLQTYREMPLIRPKATVRKELDRLVDKARTDEARKDALNRFKDRELFRIDMKHIVDPETSLSDFSLALTELAEVVMGRAVEDCQAMLTRQHGSPRLANRKPCAFAVLGMGKLGGRELGYASDIEVLFVYAGQGRTSGKHALESREYFERLAQTLVQWIEAKQEGIFHLDLRLRPHGQKGSLASPLDAIVSYYSADGLAAPFERQALIKLRHVAGDAALGRQVERHRDAFVYSGAPWDLAGALALRRRQVTELVEPGAINVKYSSGGLLDIEYAVQYLQIMHGHEHPSLRSVSTMEALDALVEARLVSRAEGEILRKAYLFIRTLIDGLRMVRGHAKDLVLPPIDSDEFVFLARRIGYATDDWRAGARRLRGDIEDHMRFTREFFGRFGP
jgi:glutamate-ammonia-ligase adenylyltransferase